MPPRLDNPPAHRIKKLGWNRAYQERHRDRLNAKNRAYHRTPRGWVSHQLSRMKTDSKVRGHKKPQIDRKFMEWVITWPWFQKLWREYEQSGFAKDKRPSVDRLDNSMGYRFDNFQITTWRKNAESWWQSDEFKAMAGSHLRDWHRRRKEGHVA